MQWVCRQAAVIGGDRLLVPVHWFLCHAGGRERGRVENESLLIKSLSDISGRTNPRSPAFVFGGTISVTTVARLLPMQP